MLALVTHARPGWTDEARGLLAGAHVAVFADKVDAAIEGRLLGLEMRDALLVLRPGPTSSYVFLFRKPVVEGTVAEQVLATGTGALNIRRVRGSCRINPGEAVSGGGNGKAHNGGRFGGGTTHGTRPIVQPHTKGRWPPNVLLVHAPECRNVGTRRVKGSSGTVGALGARRGGIMGQLGERKDAGQPCGYTDDEGLETVPAWECELGCPVKALDEISGELKSGGYPPAGGQRSHVVAYSKPNVRGEALFGASEGGASRFYPQFRDEGELRAWLERLITP